MKKTTLLLLTLLAFKLQAQTIQVSQEGKISHANNRVVRVLCDENEKAIYVLRALSINTSVNYTVEKYDKETLKLIYNVKDAKANAWYVDMYMLNGKPYVLLKDLEDKKWNYYLLTLNDKGEEEDRIKIGSNKGKVAIDIYRKIGDDPDLPRDKLIITENKDKPYILARVFGNNDKATVMLAFLGPDFNTIEDKTINIAKDEDDILDIRCGINNTTNEVYVITKTKTKHPAYNSQFYFHKMDNAGEFKELHIKINDSERISDARLFYGEDKSLHLIGVSIYQGFFVEKLDNIEGIEDPDMYEFEDKLTQHPPKDGDSYCDVENVYYDKGKYAAIFKSYYTYSYKKTFVNQKTGITTSSKTYFVKKTSSSNITIFNNDGIESSYYTVKLSGESDSEFDINTYIIYPFKDGYNLITRSSLANFNNGTYYLIKLNSGGAISKEVAGVLPEYANNYNLLKGYNAACYDSEGNCYVPWQLGNTGGDVGKKQIGLLKFVP